jgi:hypothetical protein
MNVPQGLLKPQMLGCEASLMLQATATRWTWFVLREKSLFNQWQ